MSILVTPSSKAALAALCRRLDMTASQVVRRLVHNYLESNGALPLRPRPRRPST